MRRTAYIDACPRASALVPPEDRVDDVFSPRGAQPPVGGDEACGRSTRRARARLRLFPNASLPCPDLTGGPQLFAAKTGGGNTRPPGENGGSLLATGRPVGADDGDDAAPSSKPAATCTALPIGYETRPLPRLYIVIGTVTEGQKAARWPPRVLFDRLPRDNPGSARRNNLLWRPRPKASTSSDERSSRSKISAGLLAADSQRWTRNKERRPPRPVA